jgi:antitoxin (DNA-binding transcriptional repressor) of toxin-antitoxin stability system
VKRTIPQRELLNNHARIIDAVAVGDSFLVTRNGIPIAEIRPIQTVGRTLVPKNELVLLASTGPHLDIEAFRADLDRVVEQGL